MEIALGVVDIADFSECSKVGNASFVSGPIAGPPQILTRTASLNIREWTTMNIPTSGCLYNEHPSPSVRITPKIVVETGHNPGVDVVVYTIAVLITYLDSYSCRQVPAARRTLKRITFYR